jgi:flagellar biosynthetic protein FliR
MTAPATDPQLAVVGLAACRAAGVCAFAPVLASAVVPRRVALGLAILLAVAALPGITAASASGAAANGATWGGAWIGHALLEFALGAAIGFVALLPVVAMRTAGALSGVQVGIGFGALYQGSGAEAGDSDAVERLMGLAAVALFVWAGGLDSLALGLLRTFDYVPLGAADRMAALPALAVGGMAACSDLALRMALPVTAVLVAEALVTGMLTRTVPALGPVQFGFPVRVMVGLAALAAGAAATGDALHGASASALTALHAWATGGAP